MMEDIVETKNLTFLGKFVIPWAIKHRNNLVLQEIKKRDATLLDIGGGKGYLVRNNLCKKSICIDEQGGLEIIKNDAGKITKEKRLPGYKIEDKLHYKDQTFNYVTMVAVIEHLYYTIKIIKEIYRVLKPKGRLIITTPLPIVEKILFFLDKGSDQLRENSIKKEHQHYFTLDSMNKITKNYFKVVKYKRFQLGVNQLFEYEKI